MLRPLERLKKAGVITYDVCRLRGVGANANVEPEDVRALLKPNTRLVAVSTASNVNGAMPPLAKIKAVLPKHVLFLCDGAQGGGHFPISMRELGADFLALAGHKGLMGIQGSGALLFSERVDPTPVLYGGTGSMSLSLDMPDFFPDALEAGTIAFPAVVSLLEGTRFLRERLSEIEEHLTALTAYLIDGVKALRDYTVYSKPNPCGIVALKHVFLQSEFLSDVLSSKYDIATRGGLHCAPLMHEELGTLDDGLLRVSFSHFSSKKEIDELLFALKNISAD